VKALRAAALVIAALTGSPALARIEITLDAESLNGMLASMAPDHVDVGLAGGRGLTIRMQDLKVTGFDPAAGPHGGITTALRLVVPDLGIDVALAPRLTLDLKDAGGGRKTPTLRFDKVMLNLPLTGAIDIAALLPPIQLMPGNGWIVDSARGSVRVKPRLTDAKTGANCIRLGLDLEVATVPAR